MTTKVKPGLTDTVEVPTYADFIDSVIPIKVIFNRPKNKKERKKISREFRRILNDSVKIYKKYAVDVKKTEDNSRLSDAEKEQKITELEIARDDAVEANDEKIGDIIKKYYKGVADFEHEGETISFTKKENAELLEEDGYDEAIGRAFNWLYTQKKPQDYERGYDQGNS